MRAAHSWIAAKRIKLSPAFSALTLAAGWLQYITDVAPSSPRGAAVYVHPRYELPWDSGKAAEERPISSYDPAVYMPPGYPKRPGGCKHFEVVQRWQPPDAAG